MAATWRVFANKIALQPDKVTSMTLATCVLQNYLLDNGQICTAVTGNDNDGLINQRDIVNRGMADLVRVGRGSADTAKDVRDMFCHYVNNEGAVGWQEDMI